MAFDCDDVEYVLSALQAEEYPPISDTATKPILALEILDVPEERIRSHLANRSAHPGLVARWNPFKRPLRGPGEDDAPLPWFVKLVPDFGSNKRPARRAKPSGGRGLHRDARGVEGRPFRPGLDESGHRIVREQNVQPTQEPFSTHVTRASLNPAE